MSDIWGGVADLVRICVVESHEHAAVVGCSNLLIQDERLRMTDMQEAGRFRREASHHPARPLRPKPNVETGVCKLQSFVIVAPNTAASCSTACAHCHDLRTPMSTCHPMSATCSADLVTDLAPLLAMPSSMHLQS